MNTDVDEAGRDPLAHIRPDESDLACRDELTGLYNRRLLTRFLGDEWSRIVERTSSVAIVMIDMDLFKDVNDRYGHLSGDEVLRTTSAILREHFRKGDFIFRYGGDEFVALLPGAGRAEANILAGRARDALTSHEFLTPSEHERIAVPVSFSIGTASWPDDGASGRELLETADTFLYVEKKRRRRRARGRSRRLGALIVALSLAVLLGIAAVVSRKALEPTTPQTPSPSSSSRLAERHSLLKEITQLRKQIYSLNKTPPSESYPAAQDERDREIAALEERVQTLSLQLADRGPAEVPPTDSAVQPTDQAPGATSAKPVPVIATPDTPAAIPIPPRPSEIRIAPPRLRREVRPNYPAMAREFGREATIDLVVLIDETGRVVRARTTGKRLGFGFEDAALEAAMKSEWQPATRGGVPVAMESSLKVTFRLEKR